MEANYSIDSSDSSFSYMNFPTATTLDNQPAASSFHRSLHAIRKPAYPNKPWNNKKPTAPLPPNPTRVYKVDRMNFRELVQMLTGAAAVSAEVPASQPHRLREVAPPPLEVAASAPQVSHEKAANPTTSTPLSALYKELMSETLSDVKQSHQKLSDSLFGNSGAVSLGLGLSASPLGWCSVPILSPGTLSSFEPSSVL